MGPVANAVRLPTWARSQASDEPPVEAWAVHGNDDSGETRPPRPGGRVIAGKRVRRTTLLRGNHHEKQPIALRKASHNANARCMRRHERIPKLAHETLLRRCYHDESGGRRIMQLCAVGW